MASLLKSGKGRTMDHMKNNNYGFWFYYFYAPVCPMLRRM
jgi:hypothetical protein